MNPQATQTMVPGTEGHNPTPATEPKRPRGPSKKKREELAAEYHRGWTDSAASPEHGMSMLGLLVLALVCLALGGLAGAGIHALVMGS